MTDIEIANSIKIKNISQIAKKLGIKRKDLILFGDYKAKINNAKGEKQGKLVLVTAINPTKAGIGKTTVSIGLADALSRLDKSVCLALREPSLGPVFGMKGGATGGGYSQVVPMEDINLHFNGDFHAITAANNLLCSLIDNHIFQGNELKINKNKIFFQRCLDLNDRALREIEFLGENNRKEGFVITAASEIMAIMCMAEDLEDLKKRLGNILIGFNDKEEPVYCCDIHGQDAMAILLKDALKPNLVQTLEGTPAIVHCGPFANIAHGCNSVVATKTALSLSDYCITEAGFGSDLGGEKFLDFKCRIAKLKPNCIVLVATVQSLKLHGGHKEENLKEENLQTLERGLSNLQKHIEVIKNVYKLPLVVTLNRYATDSNREIELVCSKVGNVPVVLNDVWGKGGEGAINLANKVMEQCALSNNDFSFAYQLEDSIEKKITDIVTKVYGGKGIELSSKAKEKIKIINKLGRGNLPIIMAKTQYSLSADKKLIGAPKNFIVKIRDIEIRSGAGFLVVVCGSILLMPGLSKIPAANNMNIDSQGNIKGLF